MDNRKIPDPGCSYNGPGAVWYDPERGRYVLEHFTAPAADWTPEGRAEAFIRHFASEVARFTPTSKKLWGILPFSIKPYLVRFFATAWADEWYVSPTAEADAHTGLRELRNRLLEEKEAVRESRRSLRNGTFADSTDHKRGSERAEDAWTQAKRIALEAGCRLAWAEHQTTRRVRVGRRWIKDEDGGVGEFEVLELPDVQTALRHLRSESRKAALAWLQGEDYVPTPPADVYRAEETDTAPLEAAAAVAEGTDATALPGTTEPARSVWEAIREAAQSWPGAAKALEASSGRRREILETFARHLHDLHGTGTRAAEVAEAKRRTAGDLDVSVNAVGRHLRALSSG